MEEILNACIPAAAEPNWWALASIGIGILVLGMALGTLIGVALERDASAIRYARMSADDLYDGRWPQ